MFVCPLTTRLMVDPVVADDGHTYDRAAIERHLKKTQLSPVTHDPISRRLVDNKLLLQEITKHVAAASEAVQRAWKSDRAASAARRLRESVKQAKDLYEAGDAEAAAEMGYAPAQDALGELLFAQKDYARALEWTQKAAEQDNPEALLRMGVIHCLLDNPDEAIPWYEKCLDTNTAAPTNLAHLYTVKGDHAAAFQCYLRGAKQGYAYNMRDVAESYKNGCGVAADLVEAGKWYKKAADKGCVESRFEMGRRHMSGVGARACLSEGLRYMELAAKGTAEDDPGGLRAQKNAQACLDEITELMIRM